MCRVQEWCDDNVCPLIEQFQYAKCIVSYLGPSVKWRRPQASALRSRNWLSGMEKRRDGAMGVRVRISWWRRFASESRTEPNHSAVQCNRSLVITVLCAVLLQYCTVCLFVRSLSLPISQKDDSSLVESNHKQVSFLFHEIAFRWYMSNYITTKSTVQFFQKKCKF